MVHGIRTPPSVIPNIVRNLAGKREEILRFALNDKLIVNCQWLIVMRGTRNPNAEGHPPPSKGGKSAAKGGCYPFKGGKSGAKRWGNRRTPRRSSFRPRAVSRRSSEQGERKSGCPKRSELPDFPTRERREGVRSARSLDLWVTFGSSQK